MSRWSEVEGLFERLRDLSEEERRTILDREADDDTRVEVVSLLTAHDEAEDFLEEPAFSHPAVSDEQWTSDLVEREWIGPYRITGVLGAGGMGVVLSAQQDHPDRAVALKLLRGGPWTSDRHVRLFHREVEALARLEHPDIARVHDAGVTDDGQHWFTMELVRGEPLDAFVERHDAGRRERLELFRRVCAAVAYAHQRGVIHCDLKPSNIFVATGSEGPVVKILDFGLARVLRAEDGADGDISRPGGMQGSLAWMSPEQARGDDEAIDVRSDVYALGVILHDLLSASRPYDLQGLATHEAVRVICEAPPTTLRGAVPRDLDTIRCKALEKEPSRRYAGAFELAEDVRRWLHREPILAHPPSAFYRLTRSLQRHRVAASATAAIIILLGLLAVQSQRQADRLGKERDEAERQRTRTARVNDFWLREVLGAANASTSPDPNIKFADLLRARAPDIDRQFAGMPDVAADVHHEFARLWRSLSSMAVAAGHLEKAVALRSKALGRDHTDTLSAKNDLASVYMVLGRDGEALRLYEEVLALRREAFEPEDHPKLLTSINNLGYVLSQRGRVSEAERLLDEALERRRRALGDLHPQTLTTKNNLATIYVQRDELARAVPILEEVLRERRLRLRDHDPKVFRSVGNLGRVLINQGRHEEAEALLVPERERARKVLGEDHVMTLDLVAALARLRRDQGDNAAAVVLAREVYERSASVTGQESPSTLKAMFKLARAHEQARSYVEAARVLEQLLKIRKRVTPRTSSSFLELYRSVAIVHANLGSWRRARHVLEGGLEFLGEELPDEHPTMLLLRGTLGTILRELGEDEEAARTLEEAYASLRKVEGDDDERTLIVLVSLAQTRMKAGRYAEAEADAKRALAGLRAIRSERSRQTLVALRTVASACMQQQKWAAAEGHLERLQEAMAAIMKGEPDARAVTMIDRAACLQRLGKFGDSERLFREAWGLVSEAGISKALNAKSSWRKLYLGMATLLERRGRAEEALEWRARLAALDEQ